MPIHDPVSEQILLLINMGTPKPEIRRLVPGRDWKPVRNGEERGSQ
jgi:hypothetical protein